MIKVTNVSKTYGPQVLLDRVSFNLNPREKVGLVGRNGHGKTTLFRLLLGQDEPDAGEIIIPKDYTLGHLEQHIAFKEANVLEEACRGLAPDLRHESWRAEKILFGLGFGPADMERHPGEFSGGFQIRLNLAKVLVSDPDCLLLDEPTNYLDIVSIRWLIRFLNAWRKEMMLITHDRHFMDQVITHTLGIHRRKLRKLSGQTAKYYQQLMQEEEIHEKTRVNDEKRRKEIELFITRFRAKARLAGLVQSRVKALEKQQKLEKLEKIETLEFEFTHEDFPAKVQLETQQLAFRYAETEPWLISELDLVVPDQARIAIIGKNGKGKSTLLRLLADELVPTLGLIKRHPKLLISYFGQTNVQRLNPHRTIEEELMASDPTSNRQRVRSICGAMMFSGDNALKRIGVLSGGEKSRVLLGKLLLTPAHCLLLDEPTNHLDMESSEALLAAIEAFPGAVILVTHDEEFLDALPEQFVIFDRQKVFQYHGDYPNFLQDVGWENEESGSSKPLAAPRLVTREPEPEPVPAAAQPTVPAEERKRRRSALLHEKSKSLKPLEDKVRSLERTIEHVELELTHAEQAMITASEKGDAAAIATLPQQQRDLQQQRDFLFQELDKATTTWEKAKTTFAAKWQELTGAGE